MDFYRSTVTCDWHTVHHQFGTIGIRCLILVQGKVDVCALRLLAVVGKIDLEACGFAKWDTAQALLIHLNDRILDLLCAFIDDGTWIIYL